MEQVQQNNNTPREYTTAEKKYLDKHRTFIGLWAKTDKNGNTFLQGTTGEKEVLNGKEEPVSIFVFKGKDSNKRNVYKAIGFNNGMDLLASLETVKTEDGGVFYKKDRYTLGENQFYEERPAGQGQMPTHTLTVNPHISVLDNMTEEDHQAT
jgi:hypothetical protein